MTFHARIREQLLGQIATASTDEAGQLNSALRLMAKWRSTLISNTFIEKEGTVVLQGPLQGLDFLARSSEGCLAAKLLGSYEQPLQPHIEQAIARRYARVLNIGCAEGYYAVGMARRMPDTQVLAFDLSETAQQVCRSLAEKNGVADRITIGALFRPADFTTYANDDVLVFCDIEGGERELLDPAVAPALAGMDLIVESHECLVPGVTRLLCDRFLPSHDITLVEDNGQRQLPRVPAWFRNWAHLDQLLAVWEWRSGPTPWLVMKAKSRRQK